MTRRLKGLFATGVLLCTVSTVFWQRSFIGRTASFRKPTEGTVLTCDDPIWFVGETGTGHLEHTFTLANRSTGHIKVGLVGKSCACVSFQLVKAVLAPGEITQLNVITDIRPKEVGSITDFREFLRVHVEGSEQDVLELQIAGTFIPPLYHHCRRLNLPAPLRIGEAFWGEIELFVNRARGVAITELRPTGFPFEASVQTRHVLGDGSFEKVVVLVSGRHVEQQLPRVGTLVILTNSTDLPEIDIPVVLKAPEIPHIVFTPERFAFGIIGRGPSVTRKVLVRLPPGGEYRIEAVTASSPHIQVEGSSSHDEPSPQAIILKCELSTEGFRGLIEEYIEVLVTTPKEPVTLRLPVSGFLRADTDNDGKPRRNVENEP